MIISSLLPLLKNPVISQCEDVQEAGCTNEDETATGSRNEDETAIGSRNEKEGEES